MAGLKVWLSGKKTYLMAGLVLLATVVLLGTGKLTPSTALTLLLIAAGVFPATFRSALAKHQADELLLLKDLAATGIYIAGRNPAGAVSAGEAAAVQGMHLVSEIQAEAPEKC